MQFNGFVAETWWDDSPDWNLGLEGNLFQRNQAIERKEKAHSRVNGSTSEIQVNGFGSALKNSCVEVSGELLWLVISNQKGNLDDAFQKQIWDLFKREDVVIRGNFN